MLVVHHGSLLPLSALITLALVSAMACTVVCCICLWVAMKIGILLETAVALFFYFPLALSD